MSGNYTLGTAEGTIRIKYDGKGADQASKGLDNLEAKALKTERAFRSIALTVGVAGGAMAAGVGMAVKAAIDFEHQISAIGAVTNATSGEMEAMRKKALQLGADTVFSASDAASAMEELAKAGVSVTDILNGAADATVALAAAGGVDLPAAAVIASNAMNAFRLRAQDLPKVADLIAGAANASAIDVHDFGESLAQAGAVAALVGVNFNDLATAIALMGNRGIKGSDAGTSLKTMLQNLQPQTKKQIELMTKLGLVTANGTNKFFDQEGHLKSLAQVSQILKDALKGTTDAQKSMILQTIFGTDAIRAAAIIADAGAAGFNKMSAALGNVTAADVAAKRMDNVAGAIEQLKGSVDTAAIALGTSLLPIIRRVADFLTLLVNKFSALDPRIQQVIAFVLVAVTAFLLFITVLATIIAAVSGVVAAFAGIAEFIPIALGIGAAVIAAAGAVYLLWKRSQAFRDLVATIGSTAKRAFEGLVTTLKPLVDFVKNKVIPTIREIANDFINRLQPAFQAAQKNIEEHVIPAFKKIQQALKDIMPTLIEMGNFLLSTMKTGWKILGTVLAVLIPILGKISGILIDILGPTIALLIKLIPILWNSFKIGLAVIGAIIVAVVAVASAVKTAFDFIINAAKAVIDFFTGVFSAVWSVIGTPVMAALGLLQSIFKLAFSVIGAIVSVFMLGLQTAWNNLQKFIVDPTVHAFQAVLTAIRIVMGIIADEIASKWAAVKAVWDVIAAFIVPPIQNAFNIIKTAVQVAMDFIRGHTSNRWEEIKALWSAAVSRVVAIANGIKAIVDKVREFFSQLKAAADGGTGTFLKFVGSIPGKILSAIGDLGHLLYSKGQAAIQGLIDGILSKIGDIGRAMGSVIGKIANYLPGSPAKVGPLSGRGYALYRGQHLTQDLATGIASARVDTEAAVRGVVSGFASQLPTSVTVHGSAATNPGGNAPSTQTTTYGDINLNVPLDDLRSITDVQDLLDFIDRLRNDSRRGIGAGV